MCFDVRVPEVRLRCSIGLSLALIACAAGDVAAQPRQPSGGAGAGGVARVLGRAPPSRPRAFQALEARLEGVAHEPGAARAAGDPLAHARRALARARELLAAGDRAGAARAEQIGWAAVELATRRLGRARALEDAREAAARAARAEQRARAARESLETVMAERARLTEADAPTAAPAAGEAGAEATE